MTHYHTLRLALHACALLFEAVGTSFIWFDTVRLSRTLSLAGFVSFGGEPEKFHRWYYHSGDLGFGLLFAGMLLAALVLWFEHRAYLRSLGRK